LFQKVNLLDFMDAFRMHGREKDYSYGAKECLFHYQENLEEDQGKPLELDVIAICSEWTEYDNLEAVLAAYDLEGVEDTDDLAEYTTVICEYDDSGSILILDW